MMRTVRLPDGTEVPALGQGTWHMGERGGAAKAEVAATEAGHRSRHDADRHRRDVRQRRRRGDGGRRDRRGQRDRLFIVSKVYPHNASRSGVPAACERSLKRLRTDRIDLYLLHWRGSHPLAETVEAFEALRAEGKIRYWGVSNFDARDMQGLVQLPDGAHCAANQVLYHAGSRGIEFDLLPWCTEHRIPIMAYSPVGQGGRLLQSKALERGGEAAQRDPGADRHRLEHAPPQRDHHPEGERPGARAGERRGRGDNADRRGPCRDRRRASAAGAASSRSTFLSVVIFTVQTRPVLSLRAKRSNLLGISHQCMRGDCFASLAVTGESER